MTESVTASQTPAPPDDEESQGYAPYAQLVKMLVPSSGCIAIYGVDGDLIWCSDGYERPDLRELVEELKSTSSDATQNFNRIQQTTSGVSAFTSMLRAADGRPLGFVVVQLGAAQSGSRSNTMAPSLLRPVLECLAGRISLEQRPDMPAEPTRAESTTDDLGMLLAADEPRPDGCGALEHLVQHCVESLNCISGAFLVPEKNISVLANREQAQGPESAELLSRTQKHLLAWVQLNDRPMVVNRIGTDAGMAPYKILSCPVRDPTQRVAGLMALFRSGDAPNFEIRDVRILEYMSRKAIGILNSEHDALTGLVNPVIFEGRVTSLLRAAGDPAGTLAYIDVDRLQAINDAFGFQAGDEVIRRVAELLRHEVHPDDLACRIAGDRFAVFSPARGLDLTKRMAEKLLESAAQLGYLQGADAVPVSLSIGIAQQGGPQPSFDHLLASAELACKRARSQGGNRLEISVAAGDIPPDRESALLAAASLKQALLSNEFRLQAQPIVDLYNDDGKVLGYEILVRMRDESGTLVSAEKFIEAAERYELMPAIDKWVLTATLKAIASHAEQLAELPLGIALNVSAQSMRSEEFADFAVAALERSDLPSESFCFEIKESAAASHLAATERFIARITGAGANVSLDDFGAGLSSLAHLKRLKVSHLKIDGGLIRRVLEDIHAESLVRGLARAAQTLGVLTVAEHVESEVLANKLKGMEIDLAQGYYYGHPRPLARAFADVARSAPLSSAGHS